MELTDDLAIQGQAVAGSPAHIFAIDVTAAEVTCPDCGKDAPLADEKAYLPGESSLLHCKHCSSVLGRFRRSQNAIWVDLRSMPAWQIQTPH